MAKDVKSVEVLQFEKRSHKTKKELAQRRQAEAQLTTGRKMKEFSEVKNNPVAHETFKIVSANLESIGKNDALYQNCINRYCMITARVCDLRKDREALASRPGLKESDREKFILSIDRQITANEKMLLEIEKESLLTVKAAACHVVKQPVKQKSALMEALESGG